MQARFLSDVTVAQFRFTYKPNIVYRAVDGSNECIHSVVISGRYRTTRTKIAIGVRDKERGILILDMYKLYETLLGNVT